MNKIPFYFNENSFFRLLNILNIYLICFRHDELSTAKRWCLVFKLSNKSFQRLLTSFNSYLSNWIKENPDQIWGTVIQVFSQAAVFQSAATNEQEKKKLTIFLTLYLIFFYLILQKSVINNTQSVFFSLLLI